MMENLEFQQHSLPDFRYQQIRQNSKRLGPWSNSIQNYLSLYQTEHLQKKSINQVTAYSPKKSQTRQVRIKRVLRCQNRYPLSSNSIMSSTIVLDDNNLKKSEKKKNKKINNIKSIEQRMEDKSTNRDKSQQLLKLIYKDKKSHLHSKATILASYIKRKKKQSQINLHQSFSNNKLSYANILKQGLFKVINNQNVKLSKLAKNSTFTNFCLSKSHTLPIDPLIISRKYRLNNMKKY